MKIWFWVILTIPLALFILVLYKYWRLKSERDRQQQEDENKILFERASHFLNRAVLERQLWDHNHSKDQDKLRHQSRQFLGRMCVFGKSAWNTGSVVLVTYRHLNYFVTAGHMFKDMSNPDGEKWEDCEVKIFLPGHSPLHCKASAFYVDPKYDFAFTRAPSSLITDLVLLDLRHVKLTKDMSVTAYGFPLGTFLGSVGRVIGIKYPDIDHSALVFGGSSGGPIVINQGGQKILVGINIRIHYNGREHWSKALHFQVLADKISMKSKQYHCSFQED